MDYYTANNLPFKVVKKRIEQCFDGKIYIVLNNVE